MGKGRPGTGVYALKNNIYVRFTWRGRRYCEYLGLEPIPANIKAAERLMARVHHDIEYDLFDYARSFPNSPLVRAEQGQKEEGEAAQAEAEARAQTIYFGDFADRWLTSLIVEKSTFEAYDPIGEKIRSLRIMLITFASISQLFTVILSYPIW